MLGAKPAEGAEERGASRTAAGGAGAPAAPAVLGAAAEPEPELDVDADAQLGPDPDPDPPDPDTDPDPGPDPDLDPDLGLVLVYGPAAPVLFLQRQLQQQCQLYIQNFGRDILLDAAGGKSQRLEKRDSGGGGGLPRQEVGGFDIVLKS